MKCKKAGSTITFRFNKTEQRVLLDRLEGCPDCIVEVLTEAANNDAREVAEHAVRCAIREVVQGVVAGELVLDLEKDFLEVEVLVDAVEGNVLAESGDEYFEEDGRTVALARARVRRATHQLARQLSEALGREVNTCIP